MKVDFARLAAPSAKSWNAVGQKNVLKKGFRPMERVVIAIGLNGKTYVHNVIFKAHEIEVAAKLMRAVEAKGEINPQHWREAERREY